MHVESERRDYRAWQDSCHEGSVEARRQVLTPSGIHSEVAKVANKSVWAFPPSVAKEIQTSWTTLLSLYFEEEK